MPDEHRFARTVHAGFVFVIVLSMVRYAAWHGISAATLLPLGGGLALGAGYLVGPVAVPDRYRQTWLLLVVAAWTGLTLAVPAYGWCAVPLFFLALRLLSRRLAVPVIVVLAAVAAIAQVALAGQPFPWNPRPALEPVLLAVLSTLIYRQLHP